MHRWVLHKHQTKNSHHESRSPRDRNQDHHPYSPLTGFEGLCNGLVSFSAYTSQRQELYAAAERERGHLCVTDQPVHMSPLVHSHDDGQQNGAVNQTSQYVYNCQIHHQRVIPRLQWLLVINCQYHKNICCNPHDRSDHQDQAVCHHKGDVGVFLPKGVVARVPRRCKLANHLQVQRVSMCSSASSFSTCWPDMHWVCFARRDKIHHWMNNIIKRMNLQPGQSIRPFPLSLHRSSRSPGSPLFTFIKKKTVLCIHSRDNWKKKQKTGWLLIEKWSRHHCLNPDIQL